ncbi:MAG TPA: bifunctional UDP-N-acetylglucosamine diphosphorylase/glucosamine-1-phosphate N-acetyltransferase GlmU [Thermomicrobiales bacterium]|jgi:bifunctional UDP-N-acetylglucosamine pyrophosphorylase/glucosamine-1-phosphate N-acetyltransferase
MPQPPYDGVALVVLAAGAGTRMKSKLPKPLHPVAGVPMIERILRAGRGADPVSTTIVVSPALSDLVERLGKTGEMTAVVQDPPLGTGDAVRRALPTIGEAGWVLSVFADHPLLTASDFAAFVAGAKASRAQVTVLTCVLDDAQAYGRIERDAADRPIGIVNRADDDPARRVGRVEVNSGLTILRMPWAADALRRLEPSPHTGEYYLTDLLKLAVADAGPNPDPWPVATVTGPPDVIHGFNDRIELAAAEAILRDRIRRRHMLQGVTIVAPETVLIDDDVAIGQDTTILPFTILQGSTTIGADCRIGPHAVVTSAVIGDRVVVRSSTIADAQIGDDSDVGPYAHVRRGTRIGRHVHIGNYAELKNAELDDHVKAGHFGYLGDAHIGSGTNIGAGTVTCNFDGTAKHHTEIGPNAFIGSDSMLVAPLTIGAEATIGAGSVVTHDVPDQTTVVGVPARAIKRRKTASNPVGDSVPTTEDGA